MPDVIRRADLIRNPETRTVRFQGEPYGAGVSLFVAHHGDKLHKHPSAEIFVVHTGRALLTAGDQQVGAGPTKDRIRAAKASGLGNLPVDRWRRNQVWLELVLTAAHELIASPRRCCWTARSRSPNPRRCATGWCTSPPASPVTPAG